MQSIIKLDAVGSWKFHRSDFKVYQHPSYLKSTLNHTYNLVLATYTADEALPTRLRLSALFFFYLALYKLKFFRLWPLQCCLWMVSDGLHMLAIGYS